MSKGIPVYQTVKTYTDALKRHGQTLLWYSSMPCMCADDFGRNDPNCSECRGRGSLFYLTKDVRVIEQKISQGDFTLVLDNLAIEVFSVTSASGSISLIPSSISGNILTFSSALQRSRKYTINYLASLEEAFNDISAVYEGKGIIRVNIADTTAQGVFAGKLSSITSIMNVTKSESINVLSFWENLILVDSSIDSSDEIVVSGTYIKAGKFLAVGISPKIRKENPLLPVEIDLQLTYPGTYHIGKGDLITLLVAEQRASYVGIATGGDYHELPLFHASRLLSIRDEQGEIDGATIVRNSEIKWGDRKPIGKFAVVLTYHPTYMVAEFPYLRHAEDKIFPKRVFLKRFDMFNTAEKRPTSKSYALRNIEEDVF